MGKKTHTKGKNRNSRGNYKGKIRGIGSFKKAAGNGIRKIRSIFKMVHRNAGRIKKAHNTVITDPAYNY